MVILLILALIKANVTSSFHKERKNGHNKRNQTVCDTRLSNQRDNAENGHTMLCSRSVS